MLHINFFLSGKNLIYIFFFHHLKLMQQELEHSVTLVYRMWKTEVNDYFEFSSIEIPFGDNIHGNQQNQPLFISKITKLQWI